MDDLDKHGVNKSQDIALTSNYDYVLKSFKLGQSSRTDCQLY